MRKLFQSFRTKFLSSFYVISLAQKISYCLPANHNPELRCVICTGVTPFALLLHLNRTALFQSESSFFLYIINLYRLTINVTMITIYISYNVSRTPHLYLNVSLLICDMWPVLLTLLLHELLLRQKQPILMYVLQLVLLLQELLLLALLPLLLALQLENPLLLLQEQLLLPLQALLLQRTSTAIARAATAAATTTACTTTSTTGTPNATPVPTSAVTVTAMILLFLPHLSPWDYSLVSVI